MSKSAFDIVNKDRKALVERIIANLEKGYIFQTSLWNMDLLRPQNPYSKVHYKGGNRLRLIDQALTKNYKDPRWITFKQAQKMGVSIKKGEKGILCEKWIFNGKKKEINKETGIEEWVTISYNPPIPNYFIVFNGDQTEGLLSLVFSRKKDENEIIQLAEQFKATSECPVIEVAQERAFYSPDQDKITLPLKEAFKDEASFFATLIHEMGHSTGHKTRFNRDMSGGFGSNKYAKEELRAELGAIFVQADLGIDLNKEHFQDHSNYLKSWISVLKNDYHELFRACAEAEKIGDRLISNYTRSLEHQQEIEKVKECKKHKLLLR